MSPFDGRQTQNNRIRGVGVRVEGVAAAAVLALELGIRERLKFVITGLAALGARDTNPPLPPQPLTYIHTQARSVHNR